MKKYINIVLVIIFLCATVVSAQEKSSVVKSATVFKQNGVSLRSPKQTGWQLVKSEKDQTAIEKKVKDEITFAGAKTIKAKHFDEERELLSYLESMKTEQLLSTHIRDSLHFNYVKYKETPCVQYDGVFNFKEEAKSDFKYFNFKGYLCRHPMNPDLVVEMEYSNYSNVRGFPDDFTATSSQFFEQTKFTKVSAK